eukprot:m.258783 g.258783  ORF g.258783 m.258783 type:complete len:52 (+) comp32292_c0_seq1:110-265(+)
MVKGNLFPYKMSGELMLPALQRFSKPTENCFRALLHTNEFKSPDDSCVHVL